MTAIVLAVFAWQVADLGKVLSTYRWTTDGQIAAMSTGWVQQADAIATDARESHR